MIVPLVKQFEANDLLIFARVADEGSFSRAAERLGLPKSTVSRRISLLEERLGERLMVRTTRRLRLTELGERLLEHARRVATEVEDVAVLVEHRKDAPVGRLRVAMPSDLAILLLADALAAFVAMHPAVSLELDLSARRVDLLGENVDLAVRIGTPPDDALLAARRVGVFPIGLYAAPSYLGERGDPGTPDDLARHDALRLLGRDGEPARWRLLQGERTLGRGPAGPRRRELARAPDPPRARRRGDRVGPRPPRRAVRQARRPAPRPPRLVPPAAHGLGPLPGPAPHAGQGPRLPRHARRGAPRRDGGSGLTGRTPPGASRDPARAPASDRDGARIRPRTARISSSSAITRTRPSKSSSTSSGVNSRRPSSSFPLFPGFRTIFPPRDPRAPTPGAR